MTLDVTKMESLLKEFAEMNPMVGTDECDTYCALCYADFDYDHTESCAWRQAREMFGLFLPQRPEPKSKMPVEYQSLLGKDPASFVAIWEPKVLQMLRLSKQVVKDDE